jgi:toxin ParE1/3/4
MPSIVIRPKAAADLAEIWAYIAEDSPRQADAFVARINEEFRLLARQPRMGRERPELLDGLRSFPVGKYVIFYVPRSRGIEVVRVLHGARDLKLFFEQEID